MSSGDWMCGACQHLNFKKRDACQRCQCPKFATPAEMSGYGVNRTEVLAGDWYCSTFNCGAHNYASRTVCYRCGALKDYTTTAMMAASTGGCYTQDSNVLPGWKTGDWTRLWGAQLCKQDGMLQVQNIKGIRFSSNLYFLPALDASKFLEKEV
ncbi:hypothetical protein E3N88_35763 [Mikania micrantha]|uniref:RanBP2-type domain-containing protein n=1 Tax=Mikania micrantha TaxID=192012 RepID=A0A5N6M4M9_9ASTR|nr:hypothetical protein E3N88_35763 [Mikania micrantha]